MGRLADAVDVGSAIRNPEKRSVHGWSPASVDAAVVQRKDEKNDRKAFERECVPI